MGKLYDYHCGQDNTHTLEASDANTGEFIVFSKYSGYMLFEGVVRDLAIRTEIVSAVRKAETLAYNKALSEIALKIEAHIQTQRLID